MSWYQTKKASKLPSLDRSKILVFDTETTGLEPTVDEILQIAILDGYGSTLFESYIKPTIHKVWPAAQQINHISPKMVKNAPRFGDVRAEIQQLFDNAELIVGYNVNFDINFVEAAGIIVSGRRFDVMTAFASYRAAVDKTFYRCCKLVECAKYFDHTYNAHDAYSDASTTLYCFDKLIDDERFTTYKRKEKKELAKSPANSSRQKRVNKFTVSIKTRKRWPLALEGLLLTFVGSFLYFIPNDKIIADLQEYFSIVYTAVNGASLQPIEYIALILIALGIIGIVIGTIRAALKIPRWISSKVKRITNRFLNHF